MNVVNVLKAGVPPQTVAQEYLDEFLERSMTHSQLDLEYTNVFVSGAFNALGFNAKLSAEQLDHIESYIWPLPLHAFSFSKSKHKVFALFLKFLESMCVYADQKQIEYENSLEESYMRSVGVGDGDGDGTDTPRPLGSSKFAISVEDLMCSPIDFFNELLSMWHRIRNALKNATKNDGIKDPLSQIEYTIFINLHKLRMVYADKFRVMDRMSMSFFELSLEGLLFVRTHDIIYKGLLAVVEEDFDYLASLDTYNYFQVFCKILQVKNKSHSHIAVYRVLIRILEQKEKSFELVKKDTQKATIIQRRTIKLTDYLTSHEMQSTYNTCLVHSKQNTLLALLDFLQVLQRNVTTVDVFNQRLVDRILHCSVSESKKAQLQSAGIYCRIMRCNYSDRQIFTQWMKYFMEHFNSLQTLETYVTSMWPHFEYMRDIDLYLRVVSNSSYKEEVRIVHAQVLLILYNVMIRDPVYYAGYLKELLRKLPNLIETLSSVPLRGILLEVFHSTNFKALTSLDPEAAQVIIEKMEETTYKIYDTAKRFNSVLTLKLFGELVRCMDHTKNWPLLEQCAAKLIRQYRHLETTLQDCDNNQQEPSMALLHDYSDVLKKLSLLVKTEYDVFDNLDYFFKTLKARMVDPPIRADYWNDNHLQLDLFAIDALGGCLRRFKRCDASTYGMEFYENLEHNIRQFVGYLEKTIVKTESITDIPLARFQTIVNTYILMHVTYNDESTICNLRLDATKYHALVYSVVMMSFQAKAFKNTLVDGANDSYSMNITEYQKLTLSHFVVLQTKAYVPNNSVWKILIYYGRRNHMFNDILSALLKELADHHFEQYRNVVSVMIFNLYKQEPKLKTSVILTILRSHRLFMESHGFENPEMVKVNTVLQVLQIVHKSLTLTRPKAKENRLQPVRHLSMLVDNVNLNAYDILTDIINELQQFNECELNSEEKKTLQYFQCYLKRRKTDAPAAIFMIRADDNNAIDFASVD